MEEFYKQVRKNLNEDVEQSVVRYVNGLRDLIQEVISLQTYIGLVMLTDV